MINAKNVGDTLNEVETTEYLCLQIDSKDNTVLHRSIPLTLSQARTSANSSTEKSIIVKVIDCVDTLPKMEERNAKLAAKLKSQAERLLTGEIDLSAPWITQSLLTSTNIVDNIITHGTRKASKAR